MKIERLLILGFKPILENYDVIAHLDSIRITEYYKIFSNFFNFVNYYFIDNYGNFYKDGQNIELKNFNLDNYDAIFIFHEETFDRLIKNNDKNDVINFIKKIPSYIQLDCSLWNFTTDDNIMKNFAAIGVAHPSSLEKINHNKKYLIHTASTKNECIITNKHNDIIYIGLVKNYIQNFIKFAKYIKRNINLYTFESQKDYAEILDKEEYITYKGVLKYNEIGKAISTASYGLCFGSETSPSGKIFDYISHGLPVIAQKTTNGAETIVLEDNLGLLFDINNLQELILPDEYFNNKTIFDTVQKKHLWKNRCEQWYKIING